MNGVDFLCYTLSGIFIMSSLFVWYMVYYSLKRAMSKSDEAIKKIYGDSLDDLKKIYMDKIKEFEKDINGKVG